MTPVQLLCAAWLVVNPPLCNLNRFPPAGVASENREAARLHKDWLAQVKQRKPWLAEVDEWVVQTDKYLSEWHYLVNARCESYTEATRREYLGQLRRAIGEKRWERGQMVYFPPPSPLP